ncbi:hypothetical protein ACFWVU_31290 [Streptomyces sp. NPDC058686]|uniref:hypothetical protein n=1 Tax=Streptomyces sp. NPDC058686 TaxID=3346599 RepID=UPI0036551D88
MPDRSLRLPLLPVGSTLLREGRPTPPPPQDTPPKSTDSSKKSSGASGSSEDDNPFAPPPEGSPDRPWQPRRPEGGQDGQGDGSGGDRNPWGGQWSDRQPGRAQGGHFGDRPGQGGGQGGPESPQGPGSGMRWDPTDPAQRRARFALLSGMWGFFFALFSWPYVALLLGALALYWGITALRAKPRTPNPDAPAPTGPAAGSKPQTTAAVSGLVTGSLALALVAATFTAQLVYSDYYTCVNDALTSTSAKACNEKLPKELRTLLGTRD